MNDLLLHLHQVHHQLLHQPGQEEVLLLLLLLLMHNVVPQPGQEEMLLLLQRRHDQHQEQEGPAELQILPMHQVEEVEGHTRHPGLQLQNRVHLLLGIGGKGSITRG